ncbi:MAG: elongation factor G, partial [Candidatus Brocadiia bacterium]|nr:elongation factor G [Candidatus Brocadiia bacterium]
VEELQLGDVLCGGEGTLEMPEIDMPKPMMSLTVVPKSRDDEQKIDAGLQKLAESDPTLRLKRERQSSELVMTGMSDLHLQVTLNKLTSRFGVSADTREPSVPYLETITRNAEGQYRHKKQTGGRGQFGEVHLRLEPNERGAGFEYIDAIKGGVIPQQYMPAIEKGIREVMGQGILAGCPIVDVKATIFFGQFHAVDSSEAAFKIAGSRAFQTVFDNCGPVLLEPIAKIEVTIPVERMGDVSGNLTGHRGRIMGMDQAGPLQILAAEIPMAEVRGFSTELQSITGGEGMFTLEVSHYEVVPAQLQQQIMTRRKASQEKK